MTLPDLSVERLTVRLPGSPAPGEARHFWRGAAERTVLDALTFEARAGEIIAVLGSNGAGKSTLLRALAGLVAPASGSASATLPVSLGVSDERSLHWRLTVRENLRFFADLQGTDRARIEPLLATVGLADRAETPVRACSSGMRSRLGLARALLRERSILLLDEMDRGLDPAGRGLLRSILGQRRQEGAPPTLVATHDLSAAECFSRALFLADGRLVHDGDPATAFARLASAP